MKILVTGATGFIGLELSKLLSDKGYRPYCLVRRPLRAPLLESLEVQIRQGDLFSPDSLKRACEGVDTVIHLGARAIFEEYDRVKPAIVDGTVNLMKAALESGVKHFIYGSSLLVYDSQNSPIDSKTPTHPVCGYGRAKAESEKRLQNLVHGSTMKLALVRLPHVYGARDLMFEQVRRGLVFYPGSGQNVFAHMHVRDCARLLMEIANQRWSGVAPVADDYPVKWIRYFEEIRKYYPRFKAVSIPEWLALGFTYAIYPIRRIMSRPSVYTPGSVVSWNLNMPVKRGLLWEDLGISPLFPSICQGIPEALDDCIPFRWIHPIKDHQR